MKALDVNTDHETPTMVLSDHPDPRPANGELLVAIQATALNRADLLQKAGKYPPPEGISPLLGLEMAGVVIGTGPGCERFRKGDRVFGLLSGGGYAQRCTIPESIAMPIPDALSFTEAAAIPEAFLTAWQALAWLGRIQRGETVLIHGGASGVGSAAIQIATRIFGCRTATTAGTESKRTFCRELGGDLAVDYKQSDFRSEIESAYGTDSIHLIVDIAGASHWHQNIGLLALDGRLILLSMLGGVKVDSMNLIPLLQKRLTVRGTTLRNRPDPYKAKLTREFEQVCMEDLQRGELRPVIDSIFDWEQADAAHEKMRTNQNMGKIILTGMNETKS